MAKRINQRHKRTAPAQPNRPSFDDGKITVEIGGKEFEFDLVTAKLATEQVEVKHGAAKDGWTCSAPFLVDLASAFAGLGISGCTPTVAYRLWDLILERWSALKKSTP